MEHITLDNIITVGNTEYTGIDIIEVNETDMKANVNISNTEVYLSVPISYVGTELSIREYFKYNTEVNIDV